MREGVIQEMKSFVMLATVAVWAISTVSNAQVQKSLIGFQGVPWGSSISAVKSKFPNAVEQDVCRMVTGTSNNHQSFKS